MKIIDFEKKGNVVRFYLGKDNCNDYWGDDWNDAPYEYNAGQVYDEYIAGYRDVAFSCDYEVLEPCNDWKFANSPYSKEDMIARKIPCIVAVKPSNICASYDDCYSQVLEDDAAEIKFFFGDQMKPGSETVGF